jgi:lipid-A-disaccharide synthase
LKKRILIVAGEASGDHHGADLVREVIRQQSEIDFYGIGGWELRSAGVKTEFDSSTLAVIGVWEVLDRLSQVFKALSWVKTELKRRPPDLVVLIDFPDFNFLVAREAKKCGVPVLYYISPQVWAWRRGRVGIVSRTVNRMLVIFPFEVDFYLRHGVVVEYVGHPLMEKFNTQLTPEAARVALRLPSDGVCVGLLPGSRPSEVNHILPTMLGAADVILRTYPEARFVLPLAITLQHSEVSRWLIDSPVPVTIVERNFDLAVKACTVAMVTSGTATLQTALLNVPMVIAYKVAPMSYLIGRLLVRVDFIGMVNLIAGRQIVREFVQHEATPRNLASACLEILKDPAKQAHMKESYSEIRTRLGEKKASFNAARAVLDMILSRKSSSHGT